MKPFEWSDALAMAARDHCNDTGPSGITGHTGADGSTMSVRIERYGNWNGNIAENIAYGDPNGADYMVQLYIDDGVASRGHRTNMLNPKLKMTGMHACPHKSYGGMIVAVYAGGMEANASGTESCAGKKQPTTPGADKKEVEVQPRRP